MRDLSIEVTYFEKGGPQNTDKALEIAKKYAEKFGINDIVIASTTGMTAEKAAEIFDSERFNIIIVTHAYYFVDSSIRQEFPKEKLELLKKRIKVSYWNPFHEWN